MNINLKQYCDGELIITDTSDYSNIPFTCACIREKR